MRRFIIILTLLIYQSSGPVYAEDILAKPDYITCMKTIDTLDFFSRQILYSACATVTERYCSAPVRDTASCLDDTIKSIRAFKTATVALLPPLPEGLTGFDRISYPRRVKMVSSEPKEPDLPECKTQPLWCTIIGEMTVVPILLRLARISKTPLP